VNGLQMAAAIPSPQSQSKPTGHSSRLSVGWRASGHVNAHAASATSATGSPLRANNDSQEKHERRLSRAQEMRQRGVLDSPSAAGSPARSARPQDGSVAPVLSFGAPAQAAVLQHDQLTELYTNCIKLCTDNV
jgi:hypothetical protein